MKQFNNEQQRVICAMNGHHLVLAPPGCGKTAVLAERIVYAHRQGVPLTEMACLTFTNRASRGMQERIRDVLGSEALQELFVGNVHRFCSLFLFANGIVADNTQIVDTDTSLSIITNYAGADELRVLTDNRQRHTFSQVINTQHLMHQLEHCHPKELLVHREEIAPAALRELCRVFALDYSTAATLVLYRQADHFRSQHASLSEAAKNLLERLYLAHCYATYKRQNDLLDFEDLLLLTYEAMTAEPSADESTPAVPRQGYSWVQVDEVQDLNPLQIAIIDLFCLPDATVVWLGDPQQAIFSFMGAKTNTLEQLRSRCKPENIHSFYQNYRSPRYLLDVFNTYASRQLAIPEALLPATSFNPPQPPYSLRLIAQTADTDMTLQTARLVEQLYNSSETETTAVVVAFNSDADQVSEALSVPHFKISGTDFFTTPPMQLLLSHLAVLSMEHNFIAWSQLFTGLQVYSSSSASRQFIHSLMELAIAPADLLLMAEGETYVSRFVDTWEQTDIVVFDTETTGLDVAVDDIVQIAALRIRQGNIVARLNTFIETAREIPLMLGETPNPLVDEYANATLKQPEQAFREFIDFCQGAVLLGHNTTFDWQILGYNLRRRTSALSPSMLDAQYLDTLKLTRLLRPRLSSYKLKNLLTKLHLEGENSHLASDDIVATLSVARYCYGEAVGRIGQQFEFLARHRLTINKFRQRYAAFYTEAVHRLYALPTEAGQPLVDELERAYKFFTTQKVIAPQPKLSYLINYISKDMLTPTVDGPTPLLAQQLHDHMQELTTIREADLCGSESMRERVFVSTVHKAKGLEFDNVIVFDVVEGKYPSAFANTPEARNEEARKLYVALSRAKKRLVVTTSSLHVTPYGRQYQHSTSPFLKSIYPLFQP